MGGLCRSEEGAMVEIREMGRLWSDGDQEVRKRVEDRMKENET
jgi:RecJ-like exonuclease